jgi:hypothetical protein
MNALGQEYLVVWDFKKFLVGIDDGWKLFMIVLSVVLVVWITIPESF